MKHWQKIEAAKKQRKRKPNLGTIPPKYSPAGELYIKYNRIQQTRGGSNVIKKCNAILQPILIECGCAGHWSVNLYRETNNRQYQQRKLGNKLFSTQCLAELQGHLGIKFIIEIHNSREGVFNGVLTTSSDTETERVFHLLNTESSNDDITPIHTVQIGEQYLGRISAIKSDGVLIAIFPENPPDHRDVFCAISDLSWNYIQTSAIGDHFHLQQQVLVKITDAGSNPPQASRKILLSNKDQFSLVYDVANSRWNMRHFADSEERILIMLDLMRHAIEHYATAAAWKRANHAQDIPGAVGEVHLEGSQHPFAPARLVRKLVANNIVKLWAKSEYEGKPRFEPDKHVHIFTIIKILTDRGYIYPSSVQTRGQSRILGFCMMEEGYEALRRIRPPHSGISTTALVSEPTCDKPEIPEPMFKGVDTNQDAEWKFLEMAPDEPDNTSVATQDTSPSISQEHVMNTGLPDQANDELGNTLKLIREYQENLGRKNEIDKILGNYQTLIEERDLLNEWLAEYKAVGDTIKLAKQIPAQ